MNSTDPTTISGLNIDKVSNKSSYKMVPKNNQSGSENISEDRLSEGPTSTNLVYNFNANNNKEIFDRITRRSGI